MRKLIVAIIFVAVLGIGYLVLNNNLRKSSGTSDSPLPTTTPTLTPAELPISGTTVRPTPEPIQSSETSKSPTPKPTATQTYTPVTHKVTIQNFVFSPQYLNIKKSDTVLWTNQDSISHTITGALGGPSSSTLTTGETYKFIFSDTGTFNYRCSIHPSMAGTIVVSR